MALAELRRLGWRAGIVALVVSLPLALPDLVAFTNSVFVLQFFQPLRLDALSLSRHDRPRRRPAPATWLAFAALLPALWLALRGRRAGPADFAAAVALVALVFFAFNKQAFNNYYFLVLGALCVAVATAQPGDGGQARPLTVRKWSPARAAAQAGTGR